MSAADLTGRLSTWCHRSTAAQIPNSHQRERHCVTSIGAPSPIKADAARHPIVRIWAAAVGVARLLLFGVLTFFLFFVVIGMLMQGQAPHAVSGIQILPVVAVMFVSGLAMSVLVQIRPPIPGRASWIGVHAGIFTLACAGWIWWPQQAGVIAGAVLLVALTSSVLGWIANRRALAGYTEAAAFYCRLACVLHPSRTMRFQSSFLNAQALGEIEKKIAAYRALALRARPEQFSMLNLCIPLACGDWEGVLGQIRSADDMLQTMKLLEIRALGELGRVDDMVETYASAGAQLSPIDFQFCRLYLLAFGGRIDGVRALLDRRLRSLRARNKAYWLFIASKTAGAPDEDTRRALASCAHGAEDETFRVNARRHLDAPAPGKVALSAESLATIAAIEERFRR